MRIRSPKQLWLALLALGMTLAIAAPAYAEHDPYQTSGGTSATLQITFGTAPRWVGISGTSVRVIRQSERPDYDMYRYGGRYYVYRNDRWYMSRRGQGQFTMIEERFVPREFSRIPRAHWRRYPQGWMDRNGYADRGRGHDRGRRSDSPASSGGNRR